MEYEFIEVLSYAGTLLKQEHTRQNSDTLVVLLPGSGYTIYGPSLYYSYSVVVELGYDVLTIEYGFQKTNQSLEREHYNYIISESKMAIDIALNAYKYNNLILIGKSLGTGIISNLIEQYCGILNVIPIFITPMKSAIHSIKSNYSLVIVGTNDPHFEDTDVKEIIGIDNVQTYIINGANHNLEVGNFIESIEYIKQCCIHIRDYISMRI